MVKFNCYNVGQFTRCPLTICRQSFKLLDDQLGICSRAKHIFSGEFILPIDAVSIIPWFWTLPGYFPSYRDKNTFFSLGPPSHRFPIGRRYPSVLFMRLLSGNIIRLESVDDLEQHINIWVVRETKYRDYSIIFPWFILYDWGLYDDGILVDETFPVFQRKQIPSSIPRHKAFLLLDPPPPLSVFLLAGCIHLNFPWGF